MANASIYVKIGADITEFQKKMNDVSAKLKSFGSKATAAGMSMTKGITLPIVAIGTAAGAAANSIDEAFSTIRAGTGATGEDLENLKESFKTVYGDVPASTQEVATAIADLNTRLGITGPELEAVATQALNLARVADEDLGSVIQNVTRTFGDWGVSVENQSTAMDTFWKVSQNTGISITSLGTKMVQYGAPLRQMGFDFDTAAAMMGKFEKEGVNTELVLGSMRIALTRMAEAGVTDASEALQIIIQDIKDAGSAGEANALALETFGSRAGPDMAAAIREGRFEIDELLATIQNSDETINAAAEDTMNFGEKFTELKNKITLALQPLGVELLGALDSLMPSIEKFVGFIADLCQWFSDLPEPVKQFAEIAVGIFAIAGPTMIGIGKFSTALGGLKKTFETVGLAFKVITSPKGLWGVAIAAIVAAVAWICTHWDEIKQWFIDLWDKVKEIFDTAWQGIKDAAKPVVDFFKDIWDGVKIAWEFVWDNIIKPIVDVWNGVKRTAHRAWDSVVGFFTGLWDGIKAAWDNVWGLIDGLLTEFWDTITGAADAFLTGIENIFEGVRDFFFGWMEVADEAIDKANEARKKQEELNKAMGITPETTAAKETSYNGLTVEQMLEMEEERKKRESLFEKYGISNDTPAYQGGYDENGLPQFDQQNFLNNMKGIGDAFENTGKKAEESSGGVEDVGIVWNDTIQKVVDETQEMADEVVNHSIVPDMVDAVIAEFNRLKSTVLENFNTMFDSINTMQLAAATPVNTSNVDYGDSGGIVNISKMEVNGVNDVDNLLNQMQNKLYQKTGRKRWF